MGSLVLLVSTTLFATLQTGPCENIRSLQLSEGIITSVELVPAGPDAAGGRGQQQGGPTLPEHCRVAAVLTPSSDSHIEMEIWLPTLGMEWEVPGRRQRWLGRDDQSWGYRRRPGRRLCGCIDSTRGIRDLRVSSCPVIRKRLSTSHIGRCTKWRFKSKAIIGEFYDRGPSLSYYNGCSTGGWQGLAAAQRYPSDFDAIIAGAPVYNRPHLHASEMQKFVEIMTGDDRLISRDKIQIIADAVMNSCDADDGVVDGLINDPQMCRFDPSSLACTGSDTGNVPDSGPGGVAGTGVFAHVHRLGRVRLYRTRVWLRSRMADACARG